jgi:flavin reductase (DIM6/NTAB) family NADH-FMN oxidoreductase RutF
MGETKEPAVTPGFTTREFRDALGAFATGVTVITSQGPDHAYGMTANAFSSLSLDPPLVLVCVKSGTEGCRTIERNGVFAVNVLASEQEPISRYFSARDRPKGEDAFREISHRRGVSGSPILEGVAAFLDCRVTASHAAGDHIIFVGEVLALGVDPGLAPLLFYSGRDRTLA